MAGVSPLGRLLGQRSPAPAREQGGESRLAAENKLIKDRIAALCESWRAGGPVSARFAVQLERTMGWEPRGDPLTGCLPVTAERPAPGE